MRLLPGFICLILFVSLSARTLDVGIGKPYTRIQEAAAQALPGDTILIHEGIYGGGDYMSELSGDSTHWITIRAASGASVIFRGGLQAMHFSDPAYLRIEGLVFEQQTGNGVNIDDAGTFDTPAHHLIIENCEWRGMVATGNNDELKLSGLDDFIIRNCRFANGSAGGSLVDMVGCHRGLFLHNTFENGGSNSIQAKGGTSEMRIEANRFINGGQRAVNIGGSTGLEFFRPQGINYEAKSVDVFSNIFIGSMAPIAYVGAVQCRVINNTMIRPTRWAVRILQETTGSPFLPCGDNQFRNNIIVYGNTGTVAINIGTNTAPESFQFSNNLWFNPDNSAWSGPNTPVNESGRILNRDPLFLDTLQYRIGKLSPAWKAGYAITEPTRDFVGQLFAIPRSIGAIEAEPVVSDVDINFARFETLVLAPQPVTDLATLDIRDFSGQDILVTRVLPGANTCETLFEGVCTSDELVISASGLTNGLYFLRVHSANATRTIKMMVVR